MICNLFLKPVQQVASIAMLMLMTNGIFVNQAQVITPDLLADNGVVHSLDAAILSSNTIADVALGNADHTSLVAAVIEAELLPALTDPLASLTVFAPTNIAFDAAVAALGIVIPSLLASDDLANILTYHVLGAEIMSADLTIGQTAQTLNTANTVKVTVTNDNNVFINQAQVNAPDLDADNGVVHSLDAVILSNSTVAGTVIDSDTHTVLELALIEAELQPALTDPFISLTVFAPTDAAFSVALTELGLTASELIESEGLQDILLYHVVSGTVLSADLVNGSVTTPSTEDVIVNIDNGVMINSSTVTTADLESSNGVVHIIDEVLLSSYLSTEKIDISNQVFPKTASDAINVISSNQIDLVILRDALGKTVKEFIPLSSQFILDIGNLRAGHYF